MVIVVNKDYSIAQITPSTVYQGSNLANELTVFAPFSMSSYPAILCNFLLPSGEYLPSLIAFYAPDQPKGFGAWTAALPASVTALSGTVKVSFAFIGNGHTIDESTTPPTISGSGPVMTTDAAEFTVQATVPALPNLPDVDIYNQIIEALASILQRQPDWEQTTETAPDYIANKPPIVPVKNGQGEATGARVNGDLEVTGDLTIDGNNLNKLLDDKVDKIEPDSGRAVYVAVKSSGGTTTQTYINLSYDPADKKIPQYDSNGVLTTNTPNGFFSKDCVNVDFFNKNIPVQLLYDGATGVLSLADVNNNVLGSVDLPLEMTVSGAYYENGFLYLTFTNGETVSISLEDLLLPEWVSNLNNIPNGSGNVPPTADAVKSYVDNSAADAIKAEISGAAVVIPDDVSVINPVVNIVTLPTVSYLNVYGKNLLNAVTVTPYSSSNYPAQAVGNADGSVVWSQGIQYIRFSCFIPANSTVSFSFSWSSNGNDSISRVSFYGATISDSDLIRTTASSANTRDETFVTTSDIYNFVIFKNSPGAALTSTITLTNLTLSIGGDASFSPYTAPTTLSLNNGSGSASITSYTTLVPPSGTVTTMTATYARDSTKVINYLLSKIEELQNALTT